MTQVGSGETHAEFTSPLDNSGVFAGTDVPFKTFWDYLETEKGIKPFQKDFPKVRREQTRLLLNETNRQLNERISAQMLKFESHFQKLEASVASLLTTSPRACAAAVRS